MVRQIPLMVFRVQCLTNPSKAQVINLISFLDALEAGTVPIFRLFKLWGL